MKRSDTGDFCVLYVETSDDRTEFFNAVNGQKKPVVIMLAEQSRVFQRPEDFNSLKYVKRHMNMPVVFVIPDSERLTQMAARNGFPVYASMDHLSDALMVGQLGRQRVLTRTTGPLSPQTNPFTTTAKKTIPLPPIEETPFQRMPPQITLPPPPVPTAPPPLPTAPPLSMQPMRPRTPRTRRSRPGKAMIILTTITLLIAGLGSFLVLFYKLPTQAAPAIQLAPSVGGHIAFLSSEQLSQNSSQGIADQVLIDLNGLPNPAPQKSYYAWLLGDKSQSDTQAVFLGVLQPNHGAAHLLYPGNSAHSNLLLLTSRFLVTEEDASVQPIAPSPDLSTWRFYGEFSQTPINSPDNTQHFSYLDHLRHLLAADPTLDQLGLPGGLNNWFYQNTSSVMEYAGSMRGQWEDSKDVLFVRRQAVRILAYLDGMSFVRQDVPPNIPLNINPRIASVGLLEVGGPNQVPASYLGHIVHHLNGLLQAGGSTPELRKEAASIITAMNNIQAWLTKVRSDAKQMMKMSDLQLQQPSVLSLINDMTDNATSAYVGQIDPVTGTKQDGATWIHTQMQSLATMQISTFKASGSSLQMVPDTRKKANLLRNIIVSDNLFPVLAPLSVLVPLEGIFFSHDELIRMR